MVMITSIIINLMFVAFPIYCGINAQMNNATKNCIEEIYKDFKVKKTERNLVSTSILAMKAFKELVPINFNNRKNTKKYHDLIKKHIKAIPIQMEVMDVPKIYCQKLLDLMSDDPGLTRRDVKATVMAQKIHLYTCCTDGINSFFEQKTSNILEILKYAYDNIVENEVLLTYEENAYARMYYTYMIKFVDFDVEFIQLPPDFCHNIHKDNNDSNKCDTSGSISAGDAKTNKSRSKNQLSIGGQSSTKRRKVTGGSKDTKKNHDKGKQIQK